MKKIFYSVAAIGILALGSCATESDYQAMSNDLCSCLTDASKGVSPEAQKMVVETQKSGKDFTNAIMEYAQKDPANAMKLSTQFTEMSTKMQACQGKLESKYENKRTAESQDEQMKKLLGYMEKEKSCEFATALIRIGLKK